MFVACIGGKHRVGIVQQARCAERRKKDLGAGRQNFGGLPDLRTGAVWAGGAVSV